MGKEKCMCWQFQEMVNIVQILEKWNYYTAAAFFLPHFNRSQSRKEVWNLQEDSRKVRLL